MFIEETTTQMETTLDLSVFNVTVRVNCPDTAVKSLLISLYGDFVAANKNAPRLYFDIRQTRQHKLITLGNRTHVAHDEGEFIYLFEKTLTLALQRQRPDLYFLHGAAVVHDGVGCLLIAPSGSGKSTTTWALLHHDFGYQSDELAPIQLQNLTVHPYPHALCLKNEPPREYPLPEETLFNERTIHIPTYSMPGPVINTPVPLAVVLLVSYRPGQRQPTLLSLTGAQAASQIYVNALNQLAHPNHGLSAAAHIAQNCLCFSLITGDLAATAACVKETLATATHSRQARCTA